MACFHYRTLLVIPDIDRSPFPIAGNPGERTPKSLLFVPMLAQNEVVGVLELDQLLGQVGAVVVVDQSQGRGHRPLVRRPLRRGQPLALATKMGQVHIRPILVDDARKAPYTTLSYPDKILAPLDFSVPRANGQ